MRAAIITGRQLISIGEVPDPTPRSGQVIVRVQACGVCDNDVRIASGEFPSASYPVVPGHEFSGEIVELGPAVQGDWRVGDRVAVDPNLPCGHCEACGSGSAVECEQHRVIGESVDGAFADYVAVPAASCYRLPETMTWAQGAMIEPTARALMGVRRFGVVAGQRSLVLGANPLAMLVLQVLCLSGVKVTVVDRDVDQLDLAATLGAHLVAPGLDGVSGEKFDTSIDCTGDPDVIEEAFEEVGVDGRLILFGTPHASARVQLSRVLLPKLKEDDDRVSRSMAGLDHFDMAMHLIASGSIRTDPLLTHAVPLSGLDEAMTLTRTQAGVKVLVLPHFGVRESKCYTQVGSADV
ncbi:alcohol dehydrogenase catalytic domain-containing protein [Saccharopolyspora sp. NPDC003752]